MCVCVYMCNKLIFSVRYRKFLREYQSWLLYLHAHQKWKTRDTIGHIRLINLNGTKSIGIKRRGRRWKTVRTVVMNIVIQNSLCKLCIIWVNEQCVIWTRFFEVLVHWCWNKERNRPIWNVTDFPLTDTEVLVTSYVQWIVQYLFLAQNKQSP